jgi:hypothetical protein
MDKVVGDHLAQHGRRPFEYVPQLAWYSPAAHNQVGITQAAFGPALAAFSA